MDRETKDSEIRRSESLDKVATSSVVVPIQEDGRNCTASNTVSSLSPLPLLDNGENKEETIVELPWWLDYISYLIHLAVFGILGVLTRYLLQKLFGPGVVGATSDESYMYLDLPSNMVGSFLMGWLGVVFKGDISKISDQLAIGLTTGYLGSLTTLSGWNQKILDLSVEGKWVFAVLGYFLGFFLVHYSIIYGIETAERFKQTLQRFTTSSKRITFRCKSISRMDNFRVHITAMVVLLLILGLLLGLSGRLEKREFKSGSSEAQLWLACMVGPLGVWLRWFLTRFNDRGLGKRALLKWVPFGTLIANVSACCVMAALAILKKEVKTQSFNTVATGLQFGLMGCLSTVSTFIAEFHKMKRSNQPWRAEAYAAATIVISFSMGTLIYSLPAWIKGYD